MEKKKKVEQEEWLSLWTANCRNVLHNELAWQPWANKGGPTANIAQNMLMTQDDSIC